MNTMNRRIEIINILIIRRHTTANELAQELGVSIRTIQYDIQALSPQYGSLNPDSTYDDWKWILIRNDSGNWEHVDHGY